MHHILNPHHQHPMLATVMCALDFMAAERGAYERLIGSDQHVAAFAAWNQVECYRKMAETLLLNMDTRNVDAQTLRALQLQYDQLCTIDKRVAKAHVRQQDWQGRLVRALEHEEENGYYDQH
jgi:hypothetical protein